MKNIFKKRATQYLLPLLCLLIVSYFFIPCVPSGYSSPGCLGFIFALPFVMALALPLMFICFFVSRGLYYKYRGDKPSSYMIYFYLGVAILIFLLFMVYYFNNNI